MEFAKRAEPVCERYRAIKKYRRVATFEQYPDEVRAASVLFDGLSQAAGESDRPRALIDMLDWLAERRERAQELERRYRENDLDDVERVERLSYDYQMLAGGRKPDPTTWEESLGIPGCTKAPLEAPRVLSPEEEARFDEALREARDAQE